MMGARRWKRRKKRLKEKGERKKGKPKDKLDQIWVNSIFLMAVRLLKHNILKSV
jgi:hypothetical protein